MKSWHAWYQGASLHGEIADWQASGRLDAAGARRARSLAGEVPDDDDWRRFWMLACAGLGIVLVASAVVCLIAANWSAFGKWERIGGAIALLATTTLVASPARTPALARTLALFLGCVLIGVLLALIGQTYQTGADPWWLFATWAALMVPWAVAGASVAIWLLVAGVANVALILWAKQAMAMSPFELMLVITVFDGGMLAVWEAAQRRRRWLARANVGPRVLAAALLGAVGVLAVGALLTPYESRVAPAFVLWLVTTAAVAGYYSRVRPDVPILALSALAAIGVCTVFVGWYFIERVGADIHATSTVLALLVLVAVALAARWLHRAAMRARPLGNATTADGEVQGPQLRSRLREEGLWRPTEGERRPVWYVSVLLGAGAWLASLLLLPLFVLILGTGDFDEIAMGMLAVVLCVTAVGAMRAAPRSDFLGQMGAAFVLLGGGMAAAAVEFGEWRAGWVALLLLGGGTYVAGQVFTGRLFSGVLIAYALTLAFRWGGGFEFSLAYQGIGSGALLAWLAVLAWGVTAWRGTPRPQAVVPLAWAFTLYASLLMLADGPAAWLGSLAEDVRYWRAAALVCAAMPLGAWVVAQWMRGTTRGGLRLERSGIAAGVLLAMLIPAWHAAPGVALGVAWTILGFALSRFTLLGIGVLGILLYLARYYYQLDVPLLHKAGWLGASGVALLTVAALTASGRWKSLR